MNRYFGDKTHNTFAYRSRWNRFMAMVLALVILITSINIDSYVLDASEQTRAETMDVTGDEEHLKLMYTEWWYDSADDIQSDIYSDTSKCPPYKEMQYKQLSRQQAEMKANFCG